MPTKKSKNFRDIDLDAGNCRRIKRIKKKELNQNKYLAKAMTGLSPITTLHIHGV